MLVDRSSDFTLGGFTTGHGTVIITQIWKQESVPNGGRQWTVEAWIRGTKDTYSEWQIVRGSEQAGQPFLDEESLGTVKLEGEEEPSVHYKARFQASRPGQP